MCKESIGLHPSPDNVNHPFHYQGKYECIDEMIALFGVDAVRHFCMCNVYKYRFRASRKNGPEDIEKAEWYMEKLIVEIDDKYADAASMTFIGTNCAESEEIHMTVAAVALKPDITAIAVCEDGSSIRYEGDLETKDQLSIEKLINAVGQLEDLRCDREGFAADFEDEKDNAFCLDVAAIDTALAAIKRLIKLEYEKE